MGIISPTCLLLGWYRLTSRLQYLHCINKGDAAVFALSHQCYQQRPTKAHYTWRVDTSAENVMFKSPSEHKTNATRTELLLEALLLWSGYFFVMMTSSNGSIFRVTGYLSGEFPTQRPVTRSFDVFFDLRLNKQLSKQSWGWWFVMPSRSLWRHRNGIRLVVPLMLSWCMWFAWIRISEQYRIFSHAGSIFKYFTDFVVSI